MGKLIVCMHAAAACRKYDSVRRQWKADGMEESASSMAEEDAKRKKLRQRLYRVGVLVSLYCQCYSKYSFQLQTFYNVDQ